MVFAQLCYHRTNDFDEHNVQSIPRKIKLNVEKYFLNRIDKIQSSVVFLISSAVNVLCEK